MTIALLALCMALAWIVWGTSQLRWHPFLVLLIAVLFLAVGVGVPLPEIASLVGKGMGKTFQSIGLLIVFGSVIGVALEQSKATHRIALGILQSLRRLPLPFAVSLIGYIVSIPVFCDSAFVILSSLNDRLATESKTARVALTVALSTGLFAPHVLVPPTPGPLAAAANLSLENLFLLIVFGGGLAFLLVLVGGFYAYYLGKKLPYIPKQSERDNALPSEDSLPSFSQAILPIVIPIVLMALGTSIPFLNWKEPRLVHFLEFLCTPTIALGIGLAIALQAVAQKKRNECVAKGLEVAAPILILTSIGGSMGLVLQQLPLSEWLGQSAIHSQWGLMIPFLLAAALKTAQGSSTVAIITTSSILFPLLTPLGFDSEMGKIWVILATGVGSMTVSHANDSYFWIVSQMGHLDINTAYRRHTFATFLQGVMGMVFLYAAKGIATLF